jgi:hypothetical protein
LHGQALQEHHLAGLNHTVTVDQLSRDGQSGFALLDAQGRHRGADQRL